MNKRPITADEVKSARKAAGLTQAEAAKLIHSDQSSWSLWESGKRKIHKSNYELFCLKSGLSKIK